MNLLKWKFEFFFSSGYNITFAVLKIAKELSSMENF